MGRRIALSDLAVGAKARIVEYSGSRMVSNKLLHMGIVPGKELTKLSQFAMRGPVALRVGRTVLALGHGMASKIIVEI
jgi:ferrous iron transport protein A